MSLGPNIVSFILSGEETDGRFSVTEFAAAPPPTPAAPMHIHKKEDEAMYVLEGNFRFFVDRRPSPPPQGPSSSP